MIDNARCIGEVEVVEKQVGGCLSLIILNGGSCQIRLFEIERALDDESDGATLRWV